MCACDVQDLNLVFAACPGLETLKLSSCACLREDALNALLPPLETRHAATIDTDDLSPVGPSQSKVPVAAVLGSSLAT